MVSTHREVGRIAPSAINILDWAYRNGPWQSVTLASGAFPDQLGPPVAGVSAHHRHDADLYTKVVNSSPPLLPDFGDYGVWNPRVVNNAIRRSRHAVLRYTHGLEWQVYRELGSITNPAPIYRVAQAVVGSMHWPPSGASYSAGDAEIYQRAQTPPQVTSGNSTSWVAWAGSHHFAHVVERLTVHNGP